MSAQPDDARVAEEMRTVLDAARALAHERVDALEDPEAAIAPFAVVDVAGETKVVLLEDVAEHLVSPEGVNRVAATLLGRYDAESFAIASRAWASPSGGADHPQAREVLRVIVGHASGLGGALFAGVERGPTGVRLSPIWQTNADSGELDG